MMSGAAAPCLGPDSSGRFTVERFIRRSPAAVKSRSPWQQLRSTRSMPKATAEGYLSLIGAGTFPFRLGNDLPGTVTVA